MCLVMLEDSCHVDTIEVARKNRPPGAGRSSNLCFGQHGVPDAFSVYSGALRGLLREIELSKE